MEDLPTVARVSKFIKNAGPAHPNRIQVPCGDDLVEPEGIPERLLEVTFPSDENYKELNIRRNSVYHPETVPWITASTVTRELDSFRPLKAPGPNGIYPAQLQPGRILLADYLPAIYWACLQLGYVPNRWREARVVFLPKPGKKDYRTASAWRPVSLTSFQLKGMEKDSLLGTLRRLRMSSGLLCQAYADDVAVLARGLHEYAVIDTVDRALGIIGDWCLDMGLRLNVTKTEITNGVRSMENCRRMVSKVSGLRPYQMLWVYRAVIRPVIEYAVVVWVNTLSVGSCRDKLNTLQRCAELLITGGLNSFSGTALDCLTGLLPLWLHLEGSAIMARQRLKRNGHWYYNGHTCGHGKIITQLAKMTPELEMPGDDIRVRVERLYEVCIRRREDWYRDLSLDHPEDIMTYTDDVHMEISGSQF
ncbi:unnamed protein product [Allacma fusca]|uniref:Reverse transcriptase domain-containing protein n=1 Tax=Allacma fusca TaxID=39272 RepID=A0A8J2KPT5_9HEXA|nr:unnamed protein product [Allacma fusca]